jgi:hypothetical protein
MTIQDPDHRSNETPSLALPSPVSTAIDRWLRARFGKPHAWNATRINAHGLSSAGVWLVEPMEDAVAMSIRLAVKDWCWEEEKFSKLSNLLTFQKHLRRGLENRSSIETSSLSHQRFEFQSKTATDHRTRIIPEVFDWEHGSPIVVANRSLWTLTEWLPGKHLEPGAIVSNELFYDAIEKLRLLHAWGVTYGSQIGTAPGLKHRYEYLLQWIDGRLSKNFRRWSDEFLRANTTASDGCFALVDRLALRFDKATE